MTFPPRTRSFAVVLLTLLAVAAFAAPAQATHSWGNYHWARTSNPFTVPLGDNVTNTAYSNWEGALGEASTDWTKSNVLDSPVTAGQGGNPKRCAAKDGRIEVCNAKYGFTGWLGLAQIWTSGPHIVRAIAKLNDSYYNGNQATYDYDAERHVMCQEVGHGYGLGHQDESGADLDTCMDYSRELDNPHPNAHDYEQLETIYSHTDQTSTVSSLPANVANAELDTPHEWGQLIEQTGRSALYVREFGNGYRIFTHVTWAEERGSAR